MPTSAPTQDRSRRRREELLRATIGLLGETGVKSVTARAVAQRAGLPLAATTYYFDSIPQLVEEALKLHVAERVEELQSLARDLGTAGGVSAEEIARRVAESVATRPGPVLVAQYQMYLEAARSPELRPAVAEALAAFERLAALLLGALGARDPEQAAGAFVALLDGFALHRVARPRPPEQEAEALFLAMRALFLDQVMDEQEREHLYDKLRQPLF